MSAALRSILVTGCGGDIALGVGRVLRQLGVARRLAGCDAKSDHPGATVFDSCALAPRADAPDYAQRLEALARRCKAELIVPMTEPELGALLKAGALERLGKIPVLAANALAVKTGLDKLATARFLKSRGLAHPWTRVVGDGPPLRLPCIIKRRSGSGGRDLLRVADKATAVALARKRPDDIWQEALPCDEEEHTVGVFRGASGETRSLSLRRGAQIGATERAEVRHAPAIARYARDIAEGLELRGAINVQLRVTPSGPVAFEINARFSSTAPFRHALGFKDVLWAFEDRLGRKLSIYRPPKQGTMVYRTYGEAVFPPRRGDGH